MVQTIFTNLTADGRPRTAILLQRGGLRAAVRRREIVKRRFQRAVNHAKIRRSGVLPGRSLGRDAQLTEGMHTGGSKGIVRQ
jgi:hypothetical protein